MLEINFFSVSHRTGISGKTNKPYDVCKLGYIVPLQDKEGAQYHFRQHGSEVKELDLSPQALDSFRDCKINDKVLVKLAPNPENPVRNFVVELVSVNGKEIATDKKVKALAP